ncbi:hypothetical protein K6119_16125 [Paracrocinitomix mangrovi]|uniref:Ppx/GppA phosphatase family protein n=1 Tax=Paracrocinitomix mangrovi TaxID=2862509 RepID=UPI001C8F0770|nr:hypothetical protein [Paracrocinitomix mangrovi]UKN01256.1 hypothetical protein K6119_16125 [Paracrocinitomix mangrovi]
MIVDSKQNGFDRIYGNKIGVGLGLGGINESLIAEDAMYRGIEALKEFVGICNEHQVEKIKAFATSAVRDAANQNDFLQLIEKEVGIEVEVISGQKEADLIYKGVKIGYDFSHPALIMDIGGGSTEFIFADSTKVIKSHSFNIGTARIYQLFEFNDPYNDDDVQKVIAYLESNTKGFFEEVNTDVLIGASGSFETFYAILNKREYPENEFEDLPADKVLTILDEVIYSSLEERMKNPLIIPIRKKMAPIAAIKIKWLMKKLNIKTLTISPYAMKEGVIQSMN